MKWETNDGELFTTKDKAILHENWLKSQMNVLETSNRSEIPIVKKERKIRKDKGIKRFSYIPKYKKEKRPRNDRFIFYLKRANSKSLQFTLSEQEFETLLSKQCHYCGSSGKIGIDRVDSSLGYTIDNSVPCCKKCNMMKFTYPLSEFLAHIKVIYKHNFN